jgi:murein DD-endopeptidase MepM/ murein hydrolase activator NlpD
MCRGTLAAIAAVSACALAPSGAAAQSSGGSGAYGGTRFYETPVIRSLQCRQACGGSASSLRVGTAAQTGWVSVKEKGGVLRIAGRNLREVGEVLFLGSSGKADNRGAEPLVSTSRWLDVAVPKLANNGKIVLLDPSGRSSKPSQARVRILRDMTAPTASGFIWPLPMRGYLTGTFGENRGDHVHSGVDLAVPSGTSIKAVADGTVILLGRQGGYGNFTCIRHASLVSCYAHQSQFLTSYGSFVRQGQVIGKVGCTGNCTGPHLHFEVRRGPAAWTTPLDPLRYLPRRF